jgi:flagellar biosynthesis protein FliQ
MAILFIAVFIALLAADFFIHKHGYFYLDKVPVFYAVFGLAGSFTLVLIAKYIRPLLKREEDYYD